MDHVKIKHSDRTNFLLQKQFIVSGNKGLSANTYILQLHRFVVSVERYEQNNKRFNNRSSSNHLLNVPFDDDHYYFMNDAHDADDAGRTWGTKYKIFCNVMNLYCNEYPKS